MDKEAIINQIIKENGYRSYLEIGYGDGYCFNRIECKYKAAVDPEAPEGEGLYKMTSDEFFAGPVDGAHGGNGFDVVFIDGLHHADQVRKDVINASKVLSENGVILLHDIAPEDEAQTIVPRQQKVWTGDVFKAWQGFKEKYPEVETRVYDVQYGLGAIWPKGKKFRAHFEVKEMTWDEYVAKRDA